MPDIELRQRIVSSVASKTLSGADSLKVFGKGSVSVTPSGELVVDHDRDIIEPAELEQASYEFVKARGDVDADHDGVKRGDLIASVFISPEMCSAMGVVGTAEQAWFSGWEITDPDTISRVKSGELKELSIFYQAQRTVLPEDQIGAKSKARADKSEVGRLRNLKLFRLSLVPEGAGKGVQVTLFKRRGDKKNMEEIMKMIAALPPEEQAKLYAQLQAMMAEQPKEDPAKPEDTPKEKALDDHPSFKALKDRLEKAEKEAADLREKDTQATFIEAAKSHGFEFLPGKLEIHAKEMRRMGEVLSKAEYDEWLKSKVSVAQALKSSDLMRVLGAGQRGEPATGADAATDKIESIAREMMAKDRNLTHRAAKALAWKQNPDLMREASIKRGRQ